MRSTAGLAPGQIVIMTVPTFEALAAPADPSTSPDPWRGFHGSEWRVRIDTRLFLQQNYTPYEGDSAFLAGPTERTTGLWAALTELFPTERERGVLDVDSTTPSSITAHGPGYIDRDAEIVVGLQTDAR